MDLLYKPINRHKAHDTESIPYPKFRRIVIIVCFIILVIWMIVIIIFTYHNPSILCGSDENINGFSLFTGITSIIGIITYIYSSDSQLKINSWIRRIPSMWNTLMDSGYTPYFNPDFYEIKNGHYVRVQNNLYDVDNVGLPKVNSYTPLNSFNMNIYKRYYGTTIFNKIKNWQNDTLDNATSILRKYIIERTRIVLIGETCMIVKAWSGEHLLIHKDKYNSFIEDQRATTSWNELDKFRENELISEERLIDGLSYFSKKLINPNLPLPFSTIKNDPIKTHYDQLINEMAVINQCNKDVMVGIKEMLTSLLLNHEVPQSYISVKNKYLDLQMAKMSKQIDAHEVQDKIVNNYDNDITVDDTIKLLEEIYLKITSNVLYTTAVTEDNRLKEVHSILDKIISEPDENLEKVLETISTSSKCNYSIPIKVMNLYALKTIKPQIEGYNTSYYKSLKDKGIQYIDTKINEQLQKYQMSKSEIPLNIALHSLKEQETLKSTNIINENKRMTNAVLAISETVLNEAKRLNDEYKKDKDKLLNLIKSSPDSDQLQAIKNKQDINLSKIERLELEAAQRSETLKKKLETDRFIEQELNYLQDKSKKLQDSIVEQSGQLQILERDNSKLNNSLDENRLKLSEALSEKDLLYVQLNELKDSHQKIIEQTGTLSVQEQEKYKKLNEEYMNQSSIVNNLYDSIKEKNTLIENITKKIEQIDNELKLKADELVKATEDSKMKTAQIAEMASKLKEMDVEKGILIDKHQVLLDSIKREGDDKLKSEIEQRELEKKTFNQEIASIQNTLMEVKVKETELQSKLKDSSIEVKSLQEQMKEKTAGIKLLNNIRMKRLNSNKNSEYKVVLDKFNKANDTISEIKSKVDILQEEKSRANEQTKQLEIKNKELTDLLQDSSKTAAMSKEHHDIIVKELTETLDQLESNKSLTKKLNEQLDSHITQKNIYEQQLATLQNNITENDKKAAADMAAAIEEKTKIQVELDKIQAREKSIKVAMDDLQIAKNDAENQNKKLKEELLNIKKNTDEDMKKLSKMFDAKLAMFKEMCGDISDHLKKYKNKIKIDLYSQNSSKLIEVDLDLDLITLLYEQVSHKYIPIQNKNISNDLRKKLNGYLMKMFPTNEIKDNNFLKYNDGKFLVFVYSMYKAISNHSGIIGAIERLEFCTPSEKYVILIKCKEFIRDAEEFFAPQLNDTVAFPDKSLSKLKLAMYHSKMEEFDYKTYNMVMDEVNKYFFIFKDTEKVMTKPISLTIPNMEEIMNEPSSPPIEPEKGYLNKIMDTINMDKFLFKDDETPPSQSNLNTAPLNQTPSSQSNLNTAPLNQTPPSQSNLNTAPINQTPPSQSNLNTAPINENINTEKKGYLDTIIDNITTFSNNFIPDQTQEPISNNQPNTDLSSIELIIPQQSNKINVVKRNSMDIDNTYTPSNTEIDSNFKINVAPKQELPPPIPKRNKIIIS